MTIYRIQADDEARSLLAPMWVGESLPIPVRKIDGGPWTIRGVVGKVVAIGDDGYSANVEYVLPDGYEPS